MYGIEALPAEIDGGPRRPSIGKALVAGLVAGLAGTAVKTVCELLVPPRPEGSESPLGAGIRIIAVHFNGHDLDPHSKYVAEKVVHWSFGTLTGAAYAVLAERVKWATVGYGVAFGIAFWVTAHEVFLPLVGWSPSPLQMTAWEQGDEFVSHCFFGLAVEMVRHPPASTLTAGDPLRHLYQRVWRAGPAWLTAICAAALFGGLAGYAALVQPATEVEAVELRVSDLDRSRRFFEGALGFETDARPDAPPEEVGDRVGLRLGDERLVLRRRADGSPAATAPATANDVRFQHLAVVVSDMDAAYARAVAAGATVVSGGGPQRLPSWNRDVDGIRAVYLRDPDGHVLELIWFPPFKGEPRWHRGEGRLFLGIDHTAVVVADTDRALAFYRNELGMAYVADSFNHGREQESLSDVPAAQVRVTSLRGERGPGVELLEYVKPGLAAAAADPAPDWTTIVRTTAVPTGAADRPSRDPDGHALAVAGHAGGGVRLAHAAAAWRGHWTRYLMEAAELGAFMVVTVWGTLLLEHPRSPVRRRLSSGLLRRALMGTIIGTTVVLIILFPWGFASAAHFNPSVTVAFLGLGRFGPWDALFYVAAQFAGGWLGVVVASLPFRRAVRHGSVDHVVTVPKAGGVMATLAAEFVISFVLFAALLVVQQHAGLKPNAAFVAGAVLIAYITFESPVSGMSLNPARTVASALPARQLAGAWPYFFAPIAGMGCAAALFGR